jgi:hypothetical protein
VRCHTNARPACVRQRTDRIRGTGYGGPEVSILRARRPRPASLSCPGAVQMALLGTGSRSSAFIPSGDPVMKQLRKYFSAVFLAVTLASVVGCASTSKQEGTGEYVDDSVITTKVKSAIFNEPTLKVAEINVETFKGVVQLSGFVSSQASVAKAGELAYGVKGVKSVKNDIRLK